MIYFLFIFCQYTVAERRAFGAEAPKARRGLVNWILDSGRTQGCLNKARAAIGSPQ